MITSDICIASSKRYVITSNAPFDVKCLQWNNEPAEIVNAEASIIKGKYVISFETIADARLFINDEEITL